jgi:hypothetical protein
VAQVGAGCDAAVPLYRTPGTDEFWKDQFPVVGLLDAKLFDLQSPGDDDLDLGWRGTFQQVDEARGTPSHGGGTRRQGRQSARDHATVARIRSESSGAPDDGVTLVSNILGRTGRR